MIGCLVDMAKLSNPVSCASGSLGQEPMAKWGLILIVLVSLVDESIGVYSLSFELLPRRSVALDILAMFQPL